MGYSRAGFDVYGVDIEPQPHFPFPFLQADAMAAMAMLLAGEALSFPDGRRLRLGDLGAISASPPCQGYSIMQNLPWIAKREYPLLILPLRELLLQTGKPYIIENVAGARFGAKGLQKRGLTEHGLQAGWLCGAMFGLPIYRHRYFETNWFWPMPGHPKHRRTRQLVEQPYGTSRTPGQRGIHKPEDVRKRTDNLVRGSALSDQAMGDTRRSPGSGNGVVGGIGHTAGWRIAAEAMGIDWMTRAELTQAIPPAMTLWLGGWLINRVCGNSEARDVFSPGPLTSAVPSD